MTYYRTEAAKRAARKRYAEHYASISKEKHYADLTTVPDDIEVREFHTPCFMCGQREGCRHRSAA